MSNNTKITIANAVIKRSDGWKEIKFFYLRALRLISRNALHFRVAMDHDRRKKEVSHGMSDFKSRYSVNGRDKAAQCTY